ncbi:MAG: TPR end-of-group domain-containing protein [Planctomycetota bacterium]
MVLEKPDAIELASARFQIAVAEEALRNHPSDGEVLRYLAHAYTLVGRHDDGLRTDLRLVELYPRDARARYNLACSYALLGRGDEAFQALREACSLGFEDVDLLRQDEDLAALRDDPRFEEIRKLAERRPNG